jgi:uncharacterized phage protein (TIGR02220 family)
MGKITLCSLEAQGLFIQICCYYWNSGCRLTEAMLKQRFSNNLPLLDELKKHCIFKTKGRENQVEISFLNEQFEELREAHEKRQNAGRKGGLTTKAMLKQYLNVDKALPQHLDKDKIRSRKEEIRKDNIREEEKDAAEILTYLNKQTGRNFTNTSLIISNLLGGNGKTKDAHYHIINVKLCDPFFKERPHLYNPDTLFGKKFDKYKNEKIDDFKVKGKVPAGEPPEFSSEEEAIAYYGGKLID